MTVQAVMLLNLEIINLRLQQKVVLAQFTTIIIMLLKNVKNAIIHVPNVMVQILMIVTLVGTKI